MRPLSLAFALLLASPVAAQTIYVSANLTTGADDGSSWANAHQGEDGLQVAINASTSGQSIYVASGTYRPTATGARATSFRMWTGVEIYGGFAGGESSPDERPASGTSPSVLTGDLNGDDTPGFGGNAENSYHVVRTTNTNATAVLDGFVVTGGNANVSGSSADRGGGILCVAGARPTIRNCDFIENRCTFGGGAGYINGASPHFLQCSFQGNVGGAFGGAFDIATGGAILFDGCTFTGNRAARAGALEIFSTSQVTVVNSVFMGNTSTGSAGGGALWIGNGGSSRIRNCTIVANSATNQAAGGIRVQGASPTITNTILWNNTGSGGAQGPNNQVSPGANVRYSIVEGGFAGTGNVATDPNFMNLAGGDFRVALPSGAVDAGDNAGVPAGTLADADGARRFFDEPSTVDTGAGSAPIVDMGAYEFTSNIGATYCVVIANSLGQIGRIDAVGSLAVAANDVTLVATDLPVNAFGFFLASRSRGHVTNPGGSSGNLCLGGAIGRYVGPGQVMNTGASGGFELLLDLTMIPQPTGAVAVQAGESWAFQAWHRDASLGFPTSNFTDGVRLTFE